MSIYIIRGGIAHVLRVYDVCKEPLGPELFGARPDFALVFWYISVTVVMERHPCGGSTSLRFWTKSSSAFYPSPPSASQSSARSAFLDGTLLSFQSETGDSSQYMLSELLRRPPSAGHRDVYSDLRNWLGNQVRVPLDRVLIDNEMACGKAVPVLWTSSQKRPDLQIVSAIGACWCRLRLNRARRSPLL